MSQILFSIFPGLLVLAGLCDLFTMKIPNAIPLALGVVFLLLAFSTWMSPQVAMWHAIALAVALAVGIAFFALGWVGGGDAKLAAGIALWLGWDDTLLQFVWISAIAGGVLSVGVLMMRSAQLPALAQSQGWLRKLHDKKSGIPYGIALSGAGLAVFMNSPIATAVLGRSG